MNFGNNTGDWNVPDRTLL